MNTDPAPVMSLACAVAHHDQCDQQPEPGVSFVCDCFCHRMNVTVLAPRTTTT